MQGSTYRIGVDIGGTFTDFTFVNDATGEVAVDKRLTTPEHPERAVMEGVRAFADRQGGALAQTLAVIHATTLLTNVVLERKGARTGLITTEGFRDVLEFGRELRYDVYDPFIVFREPIVPRDLRVGVRERVLVNGEVLEPLRDEDVHAAVEFFRRAGVQSIAICLLHSYVRDEHEQRIAEIVRRELPGVEVSLSSEVHPEPKEYERTSTTAVDAYVKPTASRYLDQLSGDLRGEGYRNPLFVMLSNGGAATAETTKRFPVQAVESGPAAGVEAAMHYGVKLGMPRLLSFDMGGTTAKLCVVLDGRAARTRDFEVDRVHRFKPGSGIPIATPVYDLLELGSGGGSIARVDGLGLLSVGPDSAGSVPGPACYGRGGAEPTITDADLVLGFLGADSFLGGSMPLDRAAAETAIRERIAEPMSMSVEEAAWGIHNLVNETMASAARVYVAEKGQTPRDLALVGFGGAGPVHATGLARKLGCRKVIVPPLPGVMSSFGLLTAPLAVERPRNVGKPLSLLSADHLEQMSRQLEEEAMLLLPPPHDRVRFERIVDVCRVGQAYPLEVPLSGAWTDDGALAALERSFAEQYAAHYGRVDDRTALELVTLRVRASYPPSAPTIVPGADTEDVRRDWPTRPVYDPASKRFVPAQVVQRGQLRVGEEIHGPAVIEERESSTVIGQGDILTLNEFGCLVIDLATEQHQTPGVTT